MNYFELFTYIGFIPLFIFIISIQSIVFWIVCKSKNERQWNKRFYQCVEVFEDSHVERSTQYHPTSMGSIILFLD
jgi:hypothetical protein